jgi:uncharacterized SAM-binding protein YcdF (DUF218 family)
MFSSKYIFETRRTRSFRYLRNFLKIFLFLSVTYICSGYLFILASKNENNLSLEKFFRKAPDLIVVFTGGAGRIPYALKMSKEFKQPQMFITGVYSKNSVNTLLNPLNLKDEINPYAIEIDYHARNTVENALSTLRYLRNKSGLQNILIVSHDYHILRIKTIFNSIRVTGDDYNFFYTGLQSDYKRWRNLKILYKEVYKFIRTYFFLMIWDSEFELGES